MKRFFFTLAVLSIVADCWAQAPGPDQGATLKQPWDAPARSVTSTLPRTTPTLPSSSSRGVPDSLKGLWRDLGVKEEDSQMPREHYSLAPLANLDMNRDIEVNPSLGPWMLFIISYSGQEAPMKARQMVSKLRDQYKLPAYVFNYGAEEKRKEYDRLQKKTQEQRETLQRQTELLKTQLPGQDVSMTPITIRTPRIQEHCGVLIGGYADENAARRMQEKVRRLDPEKLLDPRTVLLLKDPNYQQAITDPLLENQYCTQVDPKTKQTAGVNSFINPLKKSFAVHNPTVKHERAVEEKNDIEVLRKLNANESKSVLQCRKPYTLVIKQFQTPTKLQREESKANIMQSFGLAKSPEDNAAETAHNLADFLHQNSKLETYVLHTRFASIVCVGNFESVEDPNLRSMQTLLETRLQINSPYLQLMPHPIPMLIPR